MTAHSDMPRPLSQGTCDSIWDHSTQSISPCMLDLWLPIVLFVLIITFPSMQLVHKLIAPNNNYIQLPAPDHGQHNQPFWSSIQITLVFAGVLNFVTQLGFIGASLNTNQHLLLSALAYLISWSVFWAFMYRNKFSATLLFGFAAYNTLVALFKVAPMITGPVVIDGVVVGSIAHFVLSALLLLACALGAMFDLFERQYNWSFRERASDAEPLPTLETQVSWFEHATFSWITPLLLRGERQPLQKSDIWALYSNDRAVISHRFYMAFHARSLNPSILSVLFRMIRQLLFWQIVFGFLCGILEFVGPFYINRIVGYLESGKHVNSNTGSGKPNMSMPWMYIFGLFVGTLAKTLADNRAFFLGRRIAVRVKAALVSQIYTKVLRRRLNGGPDSASIGELNTLFAADVDKIAEFWAYTQSLFSVPLSLVVALVSLYKLLGWSAFSGVALMVIYLPAQSITGKLIKNRQKILMQQTDQRVSLVNELLQAIRMIKFCHYEPKFEEQLNKRRDLELSSLLKFGYFLSFVLVLFRSLPILVSLSTFACYVVIQGGTLNATIVFTALSLFSVLKGPLYQLPMIIVRIIELSVSLQRVTKVMREDEVDDHSHGPASATPVLSEIGFGGNAKFGWAADDSGFHVSDLNIRFKTGGLNVIVGPVGAGKSSILLAMLGEMYTKNGTVMKPDSVAYVAQSAWLQSDTVRANIHFGSNPDQGMYQKVIRACALERDFQVFDKGDETEIGERGVILSGGQRQRVALARATMYAAIRGRDTVVVADDVLSAVDSPTAKHIFNDCITGLLGSHTRILVTHATGLVLPKADHIVVMDKGKVAAQGTLDECRALLEGSELLKLIDSGKLDAPTPSSNPSSGHVAIRLDPGEKMTDTSVDTVKKQLSEDESSVSGSVPWPVYKLYLMASGGIVFWSLLLGLQVLQHFLGVGGDNVLRLWATAPTSGLAHLGAYAAFGAGQLFLSYWFPVVQFYGSVRASRIMHSKLVKSILNAPISWYDRTPVGRIVNRMSKDMQEIDREVSSSISWFMMIALDFVTAIVLVTVVAPSFLLFLPAVFWAYWQVAKRYLASSRELKRFDSISRSPIYSLFSETLSGVQTIRAFGESQRFISEMYSRIDRNLSPWWLMWMANRWLNIRTQALDATLVMCAAIAVVVGVQMGALDAGWAGLALTYAIGIGESILWLTRIQSYMEMSMNAVQRVNEYTQLPEEASSLTATRPPSSWPVHGQIEIRNLTLQYPSSDTPALNDISFSIPGGSKVGIVGRTGSGKSTFALALFRIFEMQSGSIVIDGLDTKNIGLGELRSRMTIIPQDPTLFTGTIRHNLDMFNEHSDAELRHALDQVNLCDVQLDETVNEGASNWSLGQKQLLAIARSMLQRSKILVLDESTASVDSTTDALIQTVLARHFQSTTVLCIAHRLRTIIDYELVVVLDHGMLVEIGAPRDLVAKSGDDPTAYFRRACQETGEFEFLVSAARKDGM